MRLPLPRLRSECKNRLILQPTFPTQAPLYTHSTLSINRDVITRHWHAEGRWTRPYLPIRDSQPCIMPHAVGVSNHRLHVTDPPVNPAWHHVSTRTWPGLSRARGHVPESRSRAKSQRHSRSVWLIQIYNGRT